MLPIRLFRIAAENRVFHHDHTYPQRFEALLNLGNVSRPLVFNTLPLVIAAGLKNDNRGVGGTDASSRSSILPVVCPLTPELMTCTSKPFCVRRFSSCAG